MTTEVQLKCERCETDAPAKVYNPSIAGQPDKRIALCDECATKDPKVVLDKSGIPEETIVTSKSKSPKASKNKAKDVETKPIDRVDIRNKIDAQEKDVDKLLGQRVKLQQQLTQLQEIIVAKRGAIAGLRDLLGDS